MFELRPNPQDNEDEAMAVEARFFEDFTVDDLVR
jgi:hypothetical protein